MEGRFGRRKKGGRRRDLLASKIEDVLTANVDDAMRNLIDVDALGGLAFETKEDSLREGG